MSNPQMRENYKQFGGIMLLTAPTQPEDIVLLNHVACKSSRRHR